ncbi:MAG: GNAT family N-acetyltransferase [Pseudomonadota bacterium]
MACLTRHGAELVSIAVRSRYRGQRVATALLQATTRKVRRLGAATLWLMVRRDNRAAVSFYRKSGFVRAATVAGYYEYMSAGWRMRRSLPGHR